MNELKVIFENDDVLVIDKPAGLLVHGEGGDATGTVVDWFVSRVPSARGVGEPRVAQDGKEVERSGIVHRLDKDTSGVMILVKNQSAFEHFKEQFHERLVKKEYRAIVYGLMKDKWGTIDRSIGRSSKDWRRRSAERGAKGKLRDAVTDWESLKSGEVNGENFSFLKLMPKTGRMHQLRVHLKAIDHPIVGDTVYSGKRLEQSANLGLKRLALHALSLKIILPDGQEAVFTAELPPELKTAMESIAPVV